MRIFLRPSRRVVVRARTWVARVAKMRCHVVRIIAVVVRSDVGDGMGGMTLTVS